MEAADYLQFFAALLFVLALMGGLALIMKRLGLQGRALSTGKKRLKIIEILPLDARRRLMLIERDDTQHLVILSTTGETVVETNIKPRQETDEKNI
ncbi:MAG: flagellar biosynthetic protein FliO [Pseudomonadota bacterium]